MSGVCTGILFGNQQPGILDGPNNAEGSRLSGRSLVGVSDIDVHICMYDAQGMTVNISMVVKTEAAVQELNHT